MKRFCANCSQHTPIQRCTAGGLPTLPRPDWSPQRFGRRRMARILTGSHCMASIHALPLSYRPDTEHRPSERGPGAAFMAFGMNAGNMRCKTRVHRPAHGPADETHNHSASSAGEETLSSPHPFMLMLMLMPCRQALPGQLFCVQQPLCDAAAAADDPRLLRELSARSPSSARRCLPRARRSRP